MTSFLVIPTLENCGPSDHVSEPTGPDSQTTDNFMNSEIRVAGPYVVAKGGRKALSTCGLRQRNLPIDLNLLTAMAPRSFRAFEPGAVNTARTAARSAS